MDRTLSAEERNLVERLIRAAAQLGNGSDAVDPVAELRAISDDPVMLGMAAGAFLAEVERHPQNRQAAHGLQLLWAAGAEEMVLIEEAVRVRQRLDQPPVREQHDRAPAGPAPTPPDPAHIGSYRQLVPVRIVRSR